jgi:pyrimidine 5'-nucleotidase
MNYRFDRQDFLAYVHDVDLRAYIAPNPALRKALQSIHCRRFIFTNADIQHANRVMAVLGVTDCFDGIIDTNVLHPYCKPDREAFERALTAAGASDPGHCALIDDLPRTIRAAREYGMRGILYGTTTNHPDADAVLDDWSRLGEVLRALG